MSFHDDPPLREFRVRAKLSLAHRHGFGYETCPTTFGDGEGLDKDHDENVPRGRGSLTPPLIFHN